MLTQTPVKRFTAQIKDLDDKTLAEKCAQVQQSKLLSFNRDTVSGDLIVLLEDGRMFYVRPAMVG